MIQVSMCISCNIDAGQFTYTCIHKKDESILDAQCIEEIDFHKFNPQYKQSELITGLAFGKMNKGE